MTAVPVLVLLPGRFPLARVADATAVRVVSLPEEPDSALLKAIEALDHQLPRQVLLLDADVTAARVAVPRAAENAGAAGVGPLDAAGPRTVALTGPLDRLVSRLTAAGIGAAATDAPAPGLPNALAYALLRYVALRGGESWFRRHPPAGLDARVAVAVLPAAPGSDGQRALTLMIEELTRPADA